MIVAAMVKTLFLCSAALYLGATLPCVAQNLSTVPVIRLSASEAAQAKQLAQDLKSAHERNDKSRAAWQAFHQTYQAAHTDLPNLMFTSDFRLAVASRSSGEVGLIGAVELTAEERSKAEALHREFVESRQALDQADKNWKEYQYQLVIDDVSGVREATAEVIVTLSTGKQVIIPNPWSLGLAFTPDFRFAVPRTF